MGEEVDLEEIAEKIFSVDPQPKFSIQIQLENSNIKELFEATDTKSLSSNLLSSS